MSLGWPFVFDYTAPVRTQFNRFLLVLMMLVLPVQTFAFAVMPGCEFSHQGQVTHQAAATAMSDDSMASCHEPEQKESLPTAHTCKHCTACHLNVAWMDPAIDAAPVVPFAHTVIPHADDVFVGHIPDGPERPPRLPLA